MKPAPGAPPALVAALVAAAALMLVPAGQASGPASSPAGAVAAAPREWNMTLTLNSTRRNISCVGPSWVSTPTNFTQPSNLLNTTLLLYFGFAHAPVNKPVEVMAFLGKNATWSPRTYPGNGSSALAVSMPGLLTLRLGHTYVATPYLIRYDLVPVGLLRDWYFAALKSIPGPQADRFPPRPVPPTTVTLRGPETWPVQEAFGEAARDPRFIALNLTKNARPGLCVPPFQGVWPIAYAATSYVTLVCPGVRVSVELGLSFMALTVSSHAYWPFQLFVTPRNVTLAMLTAFNGDTVFEPPGPPPGDTYRSYVVGFGTTWLQKDMYGTMRETSQYVMQSGDFRVHVAAAHAETLAMLYAMADRPDMRQDAWSNQYVYKILSRLATAMFALSETVRRTGYVTAEELLTAHVNLRVLAYPALVLGMACDPNALTVQTNLMSKGFDFQPSTIDAWLKEPLPAADPIPALERRLQAAYSFSGPRVSDTVLRFALNAAASLYAKFLQGALTWDTAHRRVLFYAAALVLVNTRPDAAVYARPFLGYCTSMCTTGHVTSAALDLEELGLQMRADLSRAATLFSVFSPCMASLRHDLTTEARLLDILSALPTRARLDAWAKQQAYGPMVANFTTVAAQLVGGKSPFSWMHTKAYVPEVFAQCDQFQPGDPLITIPVGANRSFIVTRKNPERGWTYLLEQVDIYNPLYFTFVTMESCTVVPAEIQSRPLLVPEAYDPCLYCGTVFVRYLGTGSVADVIYITTKAAETQFFRRTNSSMPVFDPRRHSAQSKALLLFPNGTVLSVTTFVAYEGVALPTGYIAASVGGALLALLIIALLAKMLYHTCCEGRGTRIRHPRAWRKDTYSSSGKTRGRYAPVATQEQATSGRTNYGYTND